MGNQVRGDGSVRSANTPNKLNSSRQKDFNIYRCMITAVRYVNDSLNITKNSNNPQVLYEAIILGGFQSGQILTNIRLTTKMGGQYNYEEIVLKPTTKKIGKVELNKHDGDIVYIAFNQGDPQAPVIIGNDRSFAFDQGSSKDDGPQYKFQYNGVNQEINKDGEFTLTRKGGTYSSETDSFTPDNSDTSKIYMGSNTIKINPKEKVAIGTNAIELLQQISDQLDKIATFLENEGATHTHVANLGYESLPPSNASTYVTLSSDLKTLKNNVDTIKGTI